MSDLIFSKRTPLRGSSKTGHVLRKLWRGRGGGVTLPLLRVSYCVKSVRIWLFFGPYFPAFWLNTERCCDFGKMRTRKTPNTDTFHAVIFFTTFIVKTNNMKMQYLWPCSAKKIILRLRIILKPTQL